MQLFVCFLQFSCACVCQIKYKCNRDDQRYDSNRSENMKYIFRGIFFINSDGYCKYAKPIKTAQQYRRKNPGKQKHTRTHTQVRAGTVTMMESRADRTRAHVLMCTNISWHA